MSAMQNIENFAHEHPIATVGIGLVTIAVIFYLFSGSGSSAGTTTVVQQPDTTGDAAQLAAQQSSNNAATAQAQIAADAATAQTNILAGVQNTATAAASEAAIAQATSATAVAQANDQASVTAVGDQTLASEFAAVAGIINQYGSERYSSLNDLAALQIGSINNAVGNEFATANQAISMADDVTTTQDWATRFTGAGGSTTNGLGGGGTRIAQTFASNATGAAQALGNPTTIASLDQNAINTAANNVDSATMNSLISALTAKIGDSVAFHS